MRRMQDSSPAQRVTAQIQLLLVDDDVALGELVCEYAAYEGYAVTTANTGELGLRTIARKPFALIILDVMLPGIDGFEVLERHAPFFRRPGVNVDHPRCGVRSYPWLKIGRRRLSAQTLRAGRVGSQGEVDSSPYSSLHKGALFHVNRGRRAG